MNEAARVTKVMTRASQVAVVLLSGAMLAGAVYIGARPIGRVPALGPFLDPAHGVWAVARTAELPRTASLRMAGLTDSVAVRYDDRGVPHIFAHNETDLMRALGFVVARDRLFQMELQTRAVAGTLSELVGAATLEADREARAQGLAWGALRKWRAIPDTAESHRLVTAYSDGVNAYLAQMTRDDVPLEYRLLGATPQAWKPEYTYFLLARMSLTLSWNDEELRRAGLEALVGARAADALFPVNAPIQEPIQPVPGRRAPRFAGGVLPPPAPHDSARLVVAEAFERAAESPTIAALRGTGEVAVGSNNWAVAPQRAAAGRALLSGDPHLQLTLPSIWYEVHLQVPGVIDTYGVTIPGGPIIPIGFNRSMAWTATNTGADVLDYYAETVDDRRHPTQYLLDGAWKPLERRIEEYRGRSGRVLRTDTIYHTHRGPMLRAGGQWLSRRWTALEISDEGEALHLADKARSVDEFMTVMGRYVGPAQNFLTADTLGHIAIRSTGFYPIRPATVRGDHITDGTKSANDWQGYWPVERYPQAKDPAQGYLASNNQQPKDPVVDPSYMGSNWPSPFRAMRINALLRADSAVTPDAMRRYQTDPVSAQTELFLPAMLDAVARAAAAGVADTFAIRGAALLREWDGRFTADNERAVLYDAAMAELTQRTWDELRGATNVRRGPTPGATILAELMRDPTSPWWDVRSTPARETRDSVLVVSLGTAYRTVAQRYGPPGPRWKWSGIRTATINHMLRLPGLGRTKIPMTSGRGTLSPSDGDGAHGASWRFVVELAPDVRAWGTYPGGQSGNPVSERYDDRLTSWRAGTLDTLRFPRRAADLPAPRFSLTLRPER
ncbi:MAG: penicillin acylase family protein [Gemmatimonadetes bacterium]|nr:penicillin acylase family protein [Gemmatimonadota bacterium]